MVPPWVIVQYIWYFLIIKSIIISIDIGDSGPWCDWEWDQNQILHCRLTLCILSLISHLVWSVSLRQTY